MTELDRMKAYKRSHFCNLANAVVPLVVLNRLPPSIGLDPLSGRPKFTWKCESCGMASTNPDWERTHSEKRINSIAPDKRMSGRMAVDILRNTDLWEPATVKRAQMLAVELLTKATRLLD